MRWHKAAQLAHGACVDNASSFVYDEHTAAQAKARYRGVAPSLHR